MENIKKIQKKEKYVEYYQVKDTKRCPDRMTELQMLYKRNVKHEEISLDRR
jgi:hypothetical protein